MQHKRRVKSVFHPTTQQSIFATHGHSYVSCLWLRQVKRGNELVKYAGVAESLVHVCITKETEMSAAAVPNGPF